MGQKHILVVDDDPAVRLYLDRLLVAARYRVSGVGDGRAALHRVRLERPDLVILDLLMPGVDGYDVLAMMKRDDTEAGIPVLVLSGRSSELDESDALESGADAFLHKPVDSDELLATVRRLLEPGGG